MKYFCLFIILLTIVSAQEDNTIILKDYQKIRYVRNENEIYELDVLQFDIPHYEEIANTCRDFSKMKRDNLGNYSWEVIPEERKSYLAHPCDHTYLNYNAKYNKLYVNNTLYYSMELYYKYRSDKPKGLKKTTDSGIYEIDLNTGNVTFLIKGEIPRAALLPGNDELLLIYSYGEKYEIYNINNKETRNAKDEIKNRTVQIPQFENTVSQNIRLNKKPEINKFWQRVYDK